MGAQTLIAGQIIPRHVAIIMDGNGRWANSRGLPRYEGHVKGLRTLRKLLRDLKDSKLDYLTLFTFSIDNWKRPKEETSKLMQLLRKFISNDLSELHNNNVRIRVIGSRAEIPRDIVDLIKGAETLTANNTGLYLQIAFNYSGRPEIINATKKIAIASSKGEIDPNKINNTIFENNLYSAGVPDPDLIIRTGGERRLSNFLLWQLAYTEIFFLDKLWPDFNEKDFNKIINKFYKIKRNFVKI